MGPWLWHVGKLLCGRYCWSSLCQGTGQEAQCSVAVWNSTDTQLDLSPCFSEHPTVTGAHSCVGRLLPWADQKPLALLALACISLTSTCPGTPACTVGTVTCPGTPACIFGTVTQASAQPTAPLAQPQMQGAQLKPTDAEGRQPGLTRLPGGPLGRH